MQRSRVSHHPCHRLSVPSAKRFWCRHCMMVFEDAITRWRHSRSCRSAGFDNQVRRREIETQSLQKMAETLDPEMVTQITVPREDGTSKDLCCFICRQRFVSLDDMREHVKYPCNKPSSMQRAPIPLFLPEPTFGTGIQQHYTDGPVLQSSAGAQQGTSLASTSNSQAVTVYMNEDQPDTDSEAKPTNIYVNENGETVIEVENLDLNTKSGELSLAHLLTQLSQQGIVFDQQPQGETEVITSPQEHQIVHDSVSEVDYSQPTAVDAANTLTQLAGSAFRAVNSAQETYVPPAKRIKTEQIELNYQLEQPDHPPVQTYLQKEEPYVENVSEKYIICTSESEVIRVMQANAVTQEAVEMPPEAVSSRIAFQNGESGVNALQNALTEGEVEETILCQGQPDGHSQTAVLQEVESAPAESSLTGSQMIVLQQDQPHVTDPSQHIVKTEDPSTQVIFAEQNPPSTQVLVAEQNAHSTQVIPEQNPPSTQILVAEQNTHSTQVVSEQNPPSTQVIVAEQNPSPTQVIVEEQNPSPTQVIVAEQNPSVIEQPVELEAVVSYASQENTVAVMEQVELGQEAEKHCLVIPANSEEVSTTLASESDSAVTGLLEMSGVVAPARDPQQIIVAEPETALLLPQIVSVSSSAESDGTPMVVQQESVSE